MEGSVKMDIDRLPMKRVNVVDDSGNEHFSTDKGYDEECVDKIRRIDFSWVLEKDAEKQKSSKETPAQEQWQWKGLVENLHLAREELSIILDLIGRVEANDAVTVAGMQRPKQLPGEALADIAVSAASKLQRLRQLGRYFKQSFKALDKQVERESRFYGSLIRLQQNWKVKRLRPGVMIPGNEGFTIDLQDGSFTELMALSRASSLTTVRIEKDAAGFLAVQLPQKSCRSICLTFAGSDSRAQLKGPRKQKMYRSSDSPFKEAKKEVLRDDEANESVKYSHSVLRKFHVSLFEEQVFDMVIRATYNPSVGAVHVSGMREDFLQLGISQETSLYLCLMSFESSKDGETIPSREQVQYEEIATNHADMGLVIADEKTNGGRFRLHNPLAFEIYLQDMLHRNAALRAKDRRTFTSPPQLPMLPSVERNELLGHFCLTISHRFFSSKVLSELESMVSRVPYLCLLSHPTWHSRTSSWSISLKIPNSIIYSRRNGKLLGSHDVKGRARSQFHTKVVVSDDQITVCGEGAPSITSSFKGFSRDSRVMNCFGCDLEDLSMVLLQQTASQIILWLHEEAVVVGMKVSRDFLCLYFMLDQGETVGLVAHVNPNDVRGCISWWMVMEEDDSSADIGRLSSPPGDCGPLNKRFLGYLTLEELYSVLMDLVGFCTIGSGCHP